MPLIISSTLKFRKIYIPTRGADYVNHIAACDVVAIIIMALPVMEFQHQGYKIRKIFA